MIGTASHVRKRWAYPNSRLMMPKTTLRDIAPQSKPRGALQQNPAVLLQLPAPCVYNSNPILCIPKYISKN